MWLDGRWVERAGLWAEPEVDGLAPGLVGSFPVRALAFGGAGRAGARRWAALPPPLQDGPLTAVFQERSLLPPFAERLGLAVSRRGPGGSSGAGHQSVLEQISYPTVG